MESPPHPVACANGWSPSLLKMWALFLIWLPAIGCCSPFSDRLKSPVVAGIFSLGVTETNVPNKRMLTILCFCLQTGLVGLAEQHSQKDLGRSSEAGWKSSSASEKSRSILAESNFPRLILYFKMVNNWPQQRGKKSSVLPSGKLQCPGRSLFWVILNALFWTLLSNLVT